MKLNIQFWLRFSLINLCIVALLGLLMRYKIGFEFPFFNQKYLLHSHSHFAFAGWISHTLMVLMVYCLQSRIPLFNGTKYTKIIVLNLICSYGMLLFFMFYGYGMASIFFSTLSILVSYYFAIAFVGDIRRLRIKSLSASCFRAALFFNVLSSLGTFVLAYMMITKNISQNGQLAAIYYFLHFQYNGWFFFAAMGLLLDQLNLHSSSAPVIRTAFRLFFISCLPAYFLSILWLEIPVWFYALIVVAACTQVYAWIILLLAIRKANPIIIRMQPPILRYILYTVAIALSLKVLLQLGSVIPVVSDLAFGFRPIVIAYLHLVLLAVISIFLLFYIYANALFRHTKNVLMALLLFAIAVWLNELVLAIQGIASFSYTAVPYANIMLFVAAILLLAGSGLLAYFSLKKDNKI